MTIKELLVELGGLPWYYIGLPFLLYVLVHDTPISKRDVESAVRRVLDERRQA